LPATEKNSGVRSVARALAILKSFGHPPYSRGITEISKELGLSKGTVHLLIKTMEKEGFLEQIRDSKKYRIGPAVHEIGASCVVDLRLAGRVHLHNLSRELAMSCYLAIVIGGKAVLIEKAESINPFMVVMQVGAALPYHTTSMGKILLAHAEDRVRAGIIDHVDLPALTPNTITDRDGLRKEIDKVRRQGFAVDAEETLPGVFCLAVPVRDATGNVVAALSLVAPSTALNEDNFQEPLQRLKKCASNINRDVCGR